MLHVGNVHVRNDLTLFEYLWYINYVTYLTLSERRLNEDTNSILYTLVLRVRLKKIT